MPDVLVPVADGDAAKIFLAQSYNTPNIAQDMFTIGTKGMKLMIPRTTFTGVTIQRLWDHVFADNTPFLQRYHDRRKETDLKVDAWSYAADMGSGFRCSSLTTIVNVPRDGTKTPLMEAHRFAYVRKDDRLVLTYHISSQTPRVTAGTTFRTEALMELTADSEKSDCTIEIWGNCKKMSMSFVAISYIALPRAVKEMTAAYKLMVSIIVEDLCGAGTVVVDAAEPDAPTARISVDDDAAPSAEAPGTAFQAILLVLAGMIAMVLLSSISTIRHTSREATNIARALMREEVLDRPPQHNGGVGVGDVRAGPSWLGAAMPLTEDQALREAAREAQIQTLRYRWVEEHQTVLELQRSVSWLWWIVMAQFGLMAVVMVVRLLQ